MQFIFVFAATLNAIRLDCGFPIIWPILQSLYCLSLLVLFLNFYYQTYVKASQSRNHKSTLNGVCEHDKEQ